MFRYETKLNTASSTPTATSTYNVTRYEHYDVLKVQTRITQTYVASFGLRDLSQIFSNGMYMEASPL